MCGIVGFSGKKYSQDDVLTGLKKISHRGPDESITAVYPQNSTVLGMNRLAIQDLHPHLYPFSFLHYRLIINGEIYHLPELQKLIPDFHPATSCDSELILPLYHRYGPKAFDLLTGMFALAIVDLQKQEIILARDKFGEKPLYYSPQGQSLFFASEITAFPDRVKTINSQVIPQFLTFGFLPSAQTFYRQIYKIKPGQFLKYSLTDHHSSLQLYSQIFDSLILPGHPSTSSETVASLDLDLHSIISSKMAADAPLGTFLSGGLDSSLITAIAQLHSPTPINTFSISFKNSSVDESKYSSIASKFIGTNHHSLNIVPADIIQNWDKIFSKLDEPISDPAIFPTYFLSKLASKTVKVVLSGEGADEIFGGYTPYSREIAAAKLRLIESKIIDQLLLIIPAHQQWRLLTQIQSHYTQTIYQTLWLNSFSSRQNYLRTIQDSWQPILRRYGSSTHQFIPDLLQVYDLTNYLPEQLCMKVDKMTMLHSLESRAPLLDQTLLKYLSHHHKYLLRQVAQKYLPPVIYRRPKHGFALPLSSWFKKELKTEVEKLNYLHPLIRPFVSPQTVDKIIHSRHEMSLWNLICLNSWLHLHCH